MNCLFQIEKALAKPIIKITTNIDFEWEKILKDKLILAKAEFSKLVNDLPYNEWINDAIDKISSINKWLN